MTFVPRRSLAEIPSRCSHNGRNLSAQKLRVTQAWSSPISSGDSNQAFKRMRRFEFSATQYEAISYGPSMDFHSEGFCTFMSIQIPRLTELSGGGKWNVVNPVPIDPRGQRHTVTQMRGRGHLPGLAHVVSVSNKFVFRYPPTYSPSGPNRIAEFAPTLVMLFPHSSTPGSISSSGRRSGYPAMTWHRRRVASSAQNLDVGPVIGSSKNGLMESAFGKT